MLEHCSRCSFPLIVALFQGYYSHIKPRYFIAKGPQLIFTFFFTLNQEIPYLIRRSIRLYTQARYDQEIFLFLSFDMFIYMVGQNFLFWWIWVFKLAFSHHKIELFGSYILVKKRDRVSNCNFSPDFHLKQKKIPMKSDLYTKIWYVSNSSLDDSLWTQTFLRSNWIWISLLTAEYSNDRCWVWW